MSVQKVLPHSKEALLKSYSKRLKDDIKSITENFTEILKLAKVGDETQVSRMTQCEQDHLEMNVHAANIVRACNSLTKLVSDIKQYLILNDFPSINETIENNCKIYLNMQNDCDTKLVALRDDMCSDLYEMEEEYYLSAYK